MFSAVPARQMKQPRLDDEEEGNGSEAADQARPIIAEAEDDVEQDQHAQEHSRSAEAAPIGAAMIADPEGTAADDPQDRGRRAGVEIGIASSRGRGGRDVYMSV